MLFISKKEQKRMNRLIQFVVKREQKVLSGCRDIFDVGARYQCELHAISKDLWESTPSDTRPVRFNVLPSELQTKKAVCKIEYHENLHAPSKKAAIIIELMKNKIDYTALCKKFRLQETIETKDYVSMVIFLNLFVSKDGGVKIVDT